MTRPIIAWSFSALNDFRTCPYKYWAVRVGKIVSDVTDDNAKGEDYHRDFELYVGKGKSLPPMLKGYGPALDKLRNRPGEQHTEMQLALDANYQPCGFKDWDRAWVRSVLDWALINGSRAFMIDYKFGKPKKDQTQNALAAAVLMHTYPQVQSVSTNYWYVLHDKLLPDYHVRDDLPNIWNEFLPDVNRMAKAKVEDNWPKTPGPLCGWCPVTSCQFNTKLERLAREAKAKEPD